MTDNNELVFFNRDLPAGHRSEIIQCHPNSVKRIVKWYGAFYSGDRVELHIDGVKQKLDENLELVDP